MEGILESWASRQMRKIARCACAGNTGNGFPATNFKGNPWLASQHASRHVRHARAVMHVGIANPRWRGNVPGIPRACATHSFTSGKRPMHTYPDAKTIGSMPIESVGSITNGRGVFTALDLQTL